MIDRRRIVAMGGGGFSAAPGDPELDRFVLEQSPSPRPRVCLLPTASGDPDDQIQRFYRAFHDLPCEPSHLSLFRLAARPVDIRARLLEQDIVYVGGGSMSNLLAIWRVHDLDAVLFEAWSRGVVLAGISAGSMCWFRAGVTKSHGVPRVTDGLGFLPYSNSVHWASEPERRPIYASAVRSGRIPGGFGVDDGCALVFAGPDLVETVRTRHSRGAWRVGRRETRSIDCKPLAPVEPLAADVLSLQEFRLQHR